MGTRIGAKNLTIGERKLKDPKRYGETMLSITLDEIEKKKVLENRVKTKGPRLEFLEIYKKTDSFFEARRYIKEKYGSNTYGDELLRQWIEEEKRSFKGIDKGDER